METLTQSKRLAELITSLGPDRLLLTTATIHEFLGRPFSIEIEAFSPQPVEAEQLLGQKVSVRLDLDEAERWFNGYVFRVAQEEPEDRFWPYTFTVRPWLWFLTRTADCRIFQHRSVPDIVKEIFREHGFTDFKDRLIGSYPPREYCVQYRETDFNFVQRLLEEEGIYYYFTHDRNSHTLVLADGPTAHDPVPGASTVPYYLAEGDPVEEPHISRWRFEKIVRPGQVVLNDFDFEKPGAKLEVNASDVKPHQKADYEVYDYPGEYVEADEGDRYARVRIEELHSRYEEARGASNVGYLTAGGLFDLECRDPKLAAELNDRYLLAEVHHTISLGRYFSQGEGGEHYGNTFGAIPAKITYRPRRITVVPRIQGPQTAIVVGPKGEEIHTDKYGRVKVQFHWDRYGKRDENSSCWVRVAQVWAGKNWGGIHIPRIGQEVIVEFLEGDPDRPIITGRVYNAEQMPPYDLPAHKTWSGIKSRSSKGGSPANFNEIRFEDKKGEEELYIHAEKNQTNIVENDEVTDVGHDRTETVGNDETITIGHDRTEQVGHNESITIGVNRTERVGANETISIGGSRSVTIGANKTETVAINKAETIGAAKELTIGGLYQVTVGGAMNETVAVAKTQEVGGAKATVVVGDVSEDYQSNHSTSVADDQSVRVGKNITIDAGDRIVLQSGKARITLTKDGTVRIEGKQIFVKASGNVVIKGNKVLEN